MCNLLAVVVNEAVKMFPLQVQCHCLLLYV